MASSDERPLILLALDGGGVRGLSELLIIREIMHRLRLQGSKKHTKRLGSLPKPCDYFDLIGGTSTGGLIALMLGRLRMDVDQAIAHYDRLVKDVFSKPKGSGGDGVFSAKKLEAAIKFMVNEELHDPEAPLLEDDELQICRTFVCARNANSMRIPVLFRTYHSHQTPIGCKIWEAARATSAAPTFFKRVIIGGDQPYVDGGLGSNNPTSLLLDEANNLFPSRKIGCLVSIGTGQPFPPDIPKPGLFQRILPTNVIHAIIGVATDCDNIHQSTFRRFANSPNTYYRLNVDQGMQGIQLSEWEKYDKVKSHTSQYLSDALVQATLASLVNKIDVPEGQLTPGLLVSPHPPHSMDHKQRPRLRSPVPSFKGRRDILDKMHNYFHSDSHSQRVFVLHGLGGAGKTQIALKFLAESEPYEHSARFSDIFAIDATNEQTVSTSLLTFTPEGIEKSVDAVLAWLVESPSRNWIIFFDNADDVELNLSRFFPKCNYGNILVTTRNRQLRVHTSGNGADISVGEMTPDDAKDLLFERSGEEWTTENEHVVQHLVQELGYIALAISQAGGYIKSRSISVQQYRELFQDQRDQLLQHKAAQENDPALYTTWKLSYDQLSRPAQTLLQICSILHHIGISEDMFKRAALAEVDLEDTDLEDQVEDLLGQLGKQSSGWNSLVFQEITHSLSSYSLLEFDKNDRSYSVHSLVQHWGLTTIRKNIHIKRVEVLTIISLAVIDGWDDYIYKPALLQHIGSTLITTNPQEINTRVAENIAYVYSYNEYWAEAENLGVMVMEKRKEKLEEDHPDSLTSMANLAYTYNGQGRWKEAEALGVMVLEKLGEDHPHRLRSMASLAYTYRSQGRWKEAEALDIVVIEKTKEKLGEDHPHTLTSMGNLASTYSSQGRWKEAEALEVMVMEKTKEKLGEDHPDSLTSMGNLASTYSSQSRWKEAEALEVMVMEKTKEKLGEDHPNSLTSMANLAHIYNSQGRWKEAEELEVMVIEKMKENLGEDHPDSLISMGNLASTYSSQGRWKEAEALEVIVMEKTREKLGEDHPRSLKSMAKLASIYRSQGRWKEAEELEESGM